MTEIDPLTMTSQLIAAFQTVREAVEKAEIDQEYCDREYNDLTHALELINFNGVEGFKLAKQMKDNRVRRRDAKNLIEQLQPLHELMNRHQSFFKDLKKVHAQIETTIHSQQKRTYTPRVRTDIPFERQG